MTDKKLSAYNIEKSWDIMDAATIIKGYCVHVQLENNMYNLKITETDSSVVYFNGIATFKDVNLILQAYFMNL